MDRRSPYKVWRQTQEKTQRKHKTCLCKRGYGKGARRGWEGVFSFQNVATCVCLARRGPLRLQGLFGFITAVISSVRGRRAILLHLDTALAQIQPARVSNAKMHSETEGSKKT